MAKLQFSAWQAPGIARPLRHRGARPRHGLSSFPAGGAYANVGINMRAAEERDRFVSLRACVDFSGYIDDSSIGVEGSATEEVIARGE